MASWFKESRWSFFALFTSFGTLICCALPATLVALGAGASLAGLVGYFPKIVWLSENKLMVFSLSGVLIGFGLFNLWYTRNDPCPVDPKLAAACKTGRRVSRIMLAISATIFFIGAVFAFFPL
jgi:hypothetical protein